jgi:hypothetical protein
MMMRHASIQISPRAAWSVVVIALAGLAGCGPRHVTDDLPAPARFSMQIREMLTAEQTSPEYTDLFHRLQLLGPEVDAVLVTLARDPSANTTARANALLLLAARKSPAAIPTLGRALLVEEIPRLRTAAIQGLSSLTQESDLALGLIRSAVMDPSRTVRLNALQVLDIREVATIRAMLDHEQDREVLQVALQLVSLAESRGAPLGPDRRGAYRTAADDDDPQIVFRPADIDHMAGYATGDLRVELPNSPDLPLASSAEMVAGVVPAFFAPDRSQVVYEADRHIHVVDLASREVRTVGPGIAPRLVPFSDRFVFVREQADGRIVLPDQTKIRYWVFEAPFSGGGPTLVGELTATARATRFGNYSPVRWMVVGETYQGFVLRGEGISIFPLDTPVWRSSGGSGAAGRSDPGAIWW